MMLIYGGTRKNSITNSFLVGPERMVRYHGKRITSTIWYRWKQFRRKLWKLFQRFCDDVKELIDLKLSKSSIPFPMTHSRMRLAQYSWLHHSTNRLRVSRPIAPPSASVSLLVEAMDGVGEGILEGVDDEVASVDRDKTPSSPSNPAAFNVLAALDKLSLLPLPNLFHGCPSLLRCLFNWNIRHMSVWWFFLCSESTAFNSRVVQLGANNGEWKNPEKRSSAPANAGVATVK